MSEKKFYIQNDYCEYWIDENGIIHEVFKSTFDVLTLEIAKIITDDRLKVSNGNYRPLFVELGSATRMKRDANKYLSSGESMLFLNATGILVQDEIERFGATMYTKFFKPNIPTKFFTNKDKAIYWLRQHCSDVLN